MTTTREVSGRQSLKIRDAPTEEHRRHHRTKLTPPAELPAAPNRQIPSGAGSPPAGMSLPQLDWQKPQDASAFLAVPHINWQTTSTRTALLTGIRERSPTSDDPTVYVQATGCSCPPVTSADQPRRRTNNPCPSRSVRDRIPSGPRVPTVAQVSEKTQEMAQVIENGSGWMRRDSGWGSWLSAVQLSVPLRFDNAHYVK